MTEDRGAVDILMYVCAQMNRLQTPSSVIQVDYKRRIHTVQKSASLKSICACKFQGPCQGQTNDFSEFQFLLSASTITITASHAKQTTFQLIKSRQPSI